VTPWFGVVVPAGTPQPVTARICKAPATLDVQQRLDVAGCEPKSAPLRTFADIITSDVALWANVVKEAGITSD
jgi:tripartite-type tricarboxylate transporter receptor subunit TctC